MPKNRNLVCSLFRYINATYKRGEKNIQKEKHKKVIDDGQDDEYSSPIIQISSKSEETSHLLEGEKPLKPYPSLVYPKDNSSNLVFSRHCEKKIYGHVSM